MSRTVRRAGATSLVLALLMAMTAAAGPASGVTGADSRGSDFWLAMLRNVNPASHSRHLLITGDTPTTGTVAVPGLGFSAPFSVTPGVTTRVELPPEVDPDWPSDLVEAKGIHVTAGEEVVVHGVTTRPFTTGAYLGLPTDALGTEYIVLGYDDFTQLAVVGTQDGTTVTIVPSHTTTNDDHLAGEPYEVVLNQGQTYTLTGPDLSGTIISSDHPVAVFSGTPGANIPAEVLFADNIVEQLVPTTSWGQEFLTVPLATRVGGDTFRILAATDGTVVSIDGEVVALLDRGQFHEQIIDGSSHITTGHPVLVAQFAHGQHFDDIPGDPLELVVPATSQYLDTYTFSTVINAGFTSYVNLVVPNGAVGAVTLDGVPVGVELYTPVGGSGFSSAQLRLRDGAHSLSGPVPFGATVYGLAEAHGYGYPAGLALAPVTDSSPVTIGDTVRSDGTRGQVTGTLSCPAGEVFKLQIALTQGEASGSGSAKGTCSGMAQPFKVTITTAPGPSFVAGAAEACATLQTADPGIKVVKDTVQTCEAVTVSL